MTAVYDDGPGEVVVTFDKPLVDGFQSGDEWQLSFGGDLYYPGDATIAGLTVTLGGLENQGPTILEPGLSYSGSTVLTAGNLLPVVPFDGFPVTTP